MSQISTCLIIGSITVVVLCQLLSRHAQILNSITAPQLFLACGLLYCVMKIITSWLGAPPPVQNVEDENNDPQN